MSGVTVERLTEANRLFLPRPEEPFAVIGRLIPRFDGERWTTSEALLPKAREKTYPDEAIEPAEWIGSPERAIYLALLDGQCVGHIRVSRRWNGFGFVDKIEVSRALRGRGAGTALMDAAARWAREGGMMGLSLETQDCNLLACRFYLRFGFALGGADTQLYRAGAGAGETALYFYLML